MEHLIHHLPELVNEIIHIVAMLHETGILDAGLEFLHEIVKH